MNIKQRLDQDVNRVIKLIEFCELDKSLERYVALMSQTYYFVCHSVPLLHYSLNYAKDPKFINRTFEHIKEEHAHEKLIQSDLKHLGFDVENIEEWDWTNRFYGYQYELYSHQLNHLFILSSKI